MQNAGPESPCSRLFPALAGLALTLLAAAPARAADEGSIAPWAELPSYVAMTDKVGFARRWPVRPALFSFGLAPGSAKDGWLPALGLALRLGGGVRLGVGGGLEPAGDGKIAVVALEIAL